MRLLVEGKLTPLSPSGRSWNGRNPVGGRESESTPVCRPMRIPGQKWKERSPRAYYKRGGIWLKNS